MKTFCKFGFLAILIIITGLLAACDSDTTPTAAPTPRNLSILNGTPVAGSPVLTPTQLPNQNGTAQSGVSNPPEISTVPSLISATATPVISNPTIQPTAITTVASGQPAPQANPPSTTAAPAPASPPASTQATTSGSANTEDKAIALLVQKLQKDSVYPDPNCLSYAKESETATYFDITVREKHGDGCSGDPAIAPVLDRFRVIKTDGTIQWLDFLTGNYASYDEFKASRRK